MITLLLAVAAGLTYFAFWPGSGFSVVDSSPGTHLPTDARGYPTDLNGPEWRAELAYLHKLERNIKIGIGLFVAVDLLAAFGIWRAVFRAETA